MFQYFQKHPVFLGALAFESGCTFSIHSEKCGILAFSSNFGATDMSEFLRCMCPNCRLITVLWRHKCISLKTVTTKNHYFRIILRNSLPNSILVDCVKWTRAAPSLPRVVHFASTFLSTNYLVRVLKP